MGGNVHTNHLHTIMNKNLILSLHEKNCWVNGLFPYKNWFFFFPNFHECMCPFLYHFNIKKIEFFSFDNVGTSHCVIILHFSVCKLPLPSKIVSTKFRTLHLECEGWLILTTKLNAVIQNWISPQPTKIIVSKKVANYAISSFKLSSSN